MEMDEAMIDKCAMEVIKDLTSWVMECIELERDKDQAWISFASINGVVELAEKLKETLNEDK